MYTPHQPPSDPKALPGYLQSEFTRIAQTLADYQDYVRFRGLAVEPAKREDGMLAYAKGAWNPGGGEGLYFRLGGAWTKPGILNLTSKSADYTLTLADANEGLFHPTADASARVWTIPANASVPYPLWTCITFVNQNGAGVISIAITTDTLRLSDAGTTGTRTLAANGIATAMKVTSTEWLISGVGLT